ncbi:aldose epimerase [Erysipelothrix sp. HDW6C]|uniref:aldose epimerase family protein n=1 Tax=Erysipelothrix sp. HDW6C TaxID=2714930 RepID=UPI00140784A3|nr:aldose epimerase [Erysipelothrix sp. HDW6C]QIK69690.1 aldose epimerase [Erysipelothrix sp. HDW6C]
MIEAKRMETVTLNNGIIEAVFLNYGATVISLRFLPLNRNLIVSYKNLEAYKENPVYLGSTVGPLAGRMSGPSIMSAGTEHLLSKHQNGEHLHGGIHGTTHQYFDTTTANNSVLFHGTFDHREDGYPGKVTYEIGYRLDGNTLVMTQTASPEYPMPLNLTNHMYFNLAGSDCLDDHWLKIDSDKVAEVGEDKVNSGVMLSVDATVFDFRTLQKLSEILKASHEQFAITGHIDHAFLFNSKHHLTLKCDDMAMTLTTTCPAVQIYLANYFDASFTNQNGTYAQNHSAIALEPQHIPNEWNYDQTYQNYTSKRGYRETTHYTFTALKNQNP